MVLFLRSVYIVYTVLGDVSIFVVGKDEYDELACKHICHLVYFHFQINLLCKADYKLPVLAHKLGYMIVAPFIIDFGLLMIGYM